MKLFSSSSFPSVAAFFLLKTETTVVLLFWGGKSIVGLLAKLLLSE